MPPPPPVVSIPPCHGTPPAARIPAASRAGRPRPRRRWLALAAAALLGPVAAPASPAPLSSADILQELRSFGEMGRALYIAAHPDDENTRVIAHLAHHRGVATAYLSLTRGDGGQNLLGAELGPELGLIRTHELLAARRLDGARQFFSRAIDFGFSKTPEETLAVWDRDQVLVDLVRVVRTFRPDVMISRFALPESGGGGHGHHTASAILALEAFKLAGDPAAYPEQLAGLPPWQPKRILWNGYNWGGTPVPAPGTPGVLTLEVGSYDALTGESSGEIAAASRTMHKSQGMGSVAARGTATEWFRTLAGEPAVRDLFDGVDTTWGRLPGGAAIGELAAAAFAQFDPRQPGASVPRLLELHDRLAALPPDPRVAEKRAQLDRILAACLGLYWESVAERAELVPGETLKLRHEVLARAAVPVRWVAVRYPGLHREVPTGVDLAPNQPARIESAPALPADWPPSQPYWLRTAGTPGMFVVGDAALIGEPLNPPVVAVEQVFAVGGRTLVLPDEPVQVVRDPLRGELRQGLVLIPPVSLQFGDTLALSAPGATREVVLELTAARAARGDARLETPAGWTASPASQPFNLAHAGAKARLVFSLSAPAHAATGVVAAVATVDGRDCRTGRVEIRYDHLPSLLLQPPATLKAVSLDVVVRGRKAGYLPGAGDTIAECLARLGYTVTPLTGADLNPERLREFDAVVLGVRAFNTRTDLAGAGPALAAYAEQGGNVVVLYNRPEGAKTAALAPYPLQLSNERVTDENAVITFLQPDHPALTTPNRLTAADFEGWVQERGAYFPNQWDERFAALLACHDAGEAPKAGALLVARHGRGYFVYTSLSFFRQLPDGVPGAYRLFANLLSLGR